MTSSDGEVPQEFQDSREVASGGGLAVEPNPIGYFKRGSLRLRVHRITDAGPYRNVGGDPICVLAARRARYLVMRTGGGRLIVFDVGHRRTGHTPWNSSKRAEFGDIDRGELAEFAASLGLEDPLR